LNPSSTDQQIVTPTRREPDCLLCNAHNFSHALRFNNGLPDIAGRIEVVLKLNLLWLRKLHIPEKVAAQMS
jgi:hypothetical protein